VSTQHVTEGGDEATIVHRSHRDVVRAFQLIAEALSETRELDDLLRVIADQVCHLLGADRCSIHLRDEAAGVFRGRAANTSQAIDDRVKRLVVGSAADGFTREIVETKQPVVIINAMSDPRAVRSAMRDWNTQSVMGVPMLLRDDVIGLMFVDDEGRRTDFSESAQELAMAFAGLAAIAIDQAQLNEKFRSTLETVARQNRLLRRAQALEDELSLLLIEGSSLQGTVDLVTATTQKSSAIYGKDLRRVAAAQLDDGPAAMPDVLVDTSLSASVAMTRALDEIGDKPSEVVGPFAALGLHHRYLVAPIRYQGALWGYLVVREHPARLGALDGAIARRAATNVAVELSVQDRSIGDRWEAYESLAAAMVRGSHGDDWLRRRADYLSVQLESPRVVCVVAPVRDGAPVPAPAELCRLFGELDDRPRAIGTVVDGLTVVVLEVAAPAGGPVPAEAVAREVADGLLRVGASEEIVAGISGVHRGETGVRTAYEEALQVCACNRGHVAPEGGVVLTAADIGVGRFLLSSTSPADAQRFVESALGVTAHARTAKARELLVTLDAFLATRSVSHAARHLGVHENTVRYRMARVERLTGLDVLISPDDQMTAYLAILILRIAGRLPGGAPVGHAIDPRRTAAAPGAGPG
jgi:GAF domain-containing protein/sugar diacid utilization regulator